MHFPNIRNSDGLKFRFRRIADIASRGGKVPPVYLYIAYILPGAILSYRSLHNFHVIPFVLVSVAILPLMAATNLYDDYFDYKYGYDKSDSPNTKYRKHPIYNYGLDKEYLLKWALIASVIYFGLFVVLSYFFGIVLLAIAFIGFILAYGYTGPPTGYKYHGLGGIGVFFSTLIISTMIYNVETGTISIYPLVFSLPYAIILLPVLFLGDFRDMDYDKELGFKTQPNIMGKKWSIRYPSFIFTLFYATVLILISVGYYPEIALIELLTIPTSIVALRKWVKLPTNKIENYMGNVIFACLAVLSVLIL